MAEIKIELQQLLNSFDGELHLDNLTRDVYSTDASVYRELPTAVAIPKSESDIKWLIDLATRCEIGIIPRAAGTSLAGQVVGSGIVVDITKHFGKILEINASESWVKVQPGVIRDELNLALQPHGLFFAPETSTSNRAMIGGMLGNNSCGSNSIVYGAMRDHVLEVTGFLSDGSKATFSANATTVNSDSSLRAAIDREMIAMLSDDTNAHQVRSRFPNENVKRRNTGYALDAVLNSNRFTKGGEPFNLCKLIAGSEGTLMFATELKLRCSPLPPRNAVLFCPHFDSLNDALKAVAIAMQRQLYACELIDQLVIQGARRNQGPETRLDFVKGQPAAILILEFRDDEQEKCVELAHELKAILTEQNLGTDFPIVKGEEMSAVWNVRKAGLGVVANVPGDNKPTTVVEDAAVALKDLPNYIADLSDLLRRKYQTSCVSYGHAGAGELHLRPVLNLKTEQGRRTFREIGEDAAALVKRYGGSLSGEHGDGRLRGEFIEQMVGPEVYKLFEKTKEIWDPKNIFNPGKIVRSPPMDASIKHRTSAEVETWFDFSTEGGIAAAAEMCSGSGDCRKTHLSGGTMCPSYMATRNETDTTRARANVLRRVMTERNDTQRLANAELKSVMDLCLSCKGCKSECPSNIDMAKMKAEVQQAWYDANGVPRRAKSLGAFAKMAGRAQFASSIINRIGKLKPFKSMFGVHPDRSIPELAKLDFRTWFKSHTPHKNSGSRGTVLVFCDEFTNFLDPHVGIAAVELLERMGVQAELANIVDSGRSAISQGLLRDAKKIVHENVNSLNDCVSSDKPLIGIEPSALLSFRDEYPALLRGEQKVKALTLAANCLMIDEYLESFAASGKLNSQLFSKEKETIRLHGHCHQKAIYGLASTVKMLQLPKNYQVRLIPSGCCGMAGSFGYEKEHYDLSMKIGELVLFPTIRKEPESNLIAAPGTSCRQQILDGTGRRALHPVEILRNAMIEA